MAGLHFYVNPSLTSAVLSKSAHHIVIQLPYTNVIGFYYQSTMSFDDIANDISKALNQCPLHLPIAFGGDLNLHPGSSELDEFLKILALYDIALMSNKSLSTFHGLKNSYHLDYTFASRNLSAASDRVVQASMSDHLPLIFSPTFPQSIPKYNTASTSYKLDIDMCAKPTKGS